MWEGSRNPGMGRYPDLRPPGLGPKKPPVLHVGPMGCFLVVLVLMVMSCGVVWCGLMWCGLVW